MIGAGVMYGVVHLIDIPEIQGGESNKGGRWRELRLRRSFEFLQSQYYLVRLGTSGTRPARFLEDDDGNVIPTPATWRAEEFPPACCYASITK